MIIQSLRRHGHSRGRSASSMSRGQTTAGISKRLWIALITLGTAATPGCSTTPTTADIVESWRQRPDERGLLPLGTVVSVERVEVIHEHRAPSNAQQAALIAGIGVVPGTLLAGTLGSIRTTSALFRTQIRLKTGELWVRELNYLLQPGDCIAFRSGLSADDVLAIPALPGECS